jgi:hypothetical protein
MPSLYLATSKINRTLEVLVAKIDDVISTASPDAPFLSHDAWISSWLSLCVVLKGLNWKAKDIGAERRDALRAAMDVFIEEHKKLMKLVAVRVKGRNFAGAHAW